MGSQRWFAMGVVAVSAVVGIAAYSIGLSQGAAHAAAAAGAYGDWGWHRHWVGGFPFGTLILFWFVLALVRGAFWGRPWYRRRWHYYWDEDDPQTFEARHRRAHERMSDSQPPRT